MSLIGPRPDPLDDMDIYTEHQKKKLAVRPGITGYNQAYYRNSVLEYRNILNKMLKEAVRAGKEADVSYLYELSHIKS